MRILRVLVPASLDPARAESWALFDAGDRLLQHGHSVAGQWPPAERREAVIGAEAVRVVALVLPPLSRERLVTAATFALEDRVATPTEDAVVAVGDRGSHGRVTVVMTAREIVDTLFAATPPFARAVAEPTLALPTDGWRWCEAETGGFVRTDDGTAFTVSRSTGDALPTELVLALARAARDDRGPASVVVDRLTDAATLARWQQETGVQFIAGTPWRWETASPSSFAAATDVMAALREASSTRTRSSRPGYSFALGVAALALGLHVLAGLGTWAWQRASLARAEQALVPIAQQAGARNAVASDAAQSIRTLYADARHRAGLPTPNDAMPVLARAAPAFAALPAGALRIATWNAGAWTLELAPLDEAALSGFIQRIGAAGLSLLHARTASGIRARVALSP